MLRFSKNFLIALFCVLLGGYVSNLWLSTPPVYSQTGGLQLRAVQNTSEGIILLINGNPQILSQRAINPDRLVIDLASTVVNPRLHKAIIPINRYGVRQIRIGQNQQNPPIARIVLDFESNSNTSNVDWEAIFNPRRSAVIVRPTTIATLDPLLPTAPPLNPSNPSINNSANNIDNLAIIQKLTLSKSGQLLIQTNQPFTYLGTEDISSGTYNITINNARISPQLVRPSLDGTALDAIRMSQVGSSVVIGLRPSSGWRIREDTRSEPQQLYVQLYQPQNVAQGGIPNIGNGEPNFDPPSTFPPRTIPLRIRPIVPPANITNRGRGVIVVDPGHGGNDVGAVGNGIYESNVVLAISLKLGRILQEMGYMVVYTRTDNTEVELQPRVDLAERVNANIFVSVHANSLEARLSTVSGIETYYAPGANLSARLATFVHNQIINITGARDRGVRSARFHVIRRTSMPSILVETGFVTNPTESANLNNSSYQERMATAIARGIDQFMKAR